MIGRLHNWLCLYLCDGCRNDPDKVLIDNSVPDSIRDVSHRLANISTTASGIANAAKKEGDTIERFARELRGG